MPKAWVLRFDEVDAGNLAQVGGKNASLGELIKNLKSSEIQVPDGFALTADAFREHLRRAELDDRIYPRLDRLDVKNVAALAETAFAIRQLIRAAPLPAAVASEALEQYRELSRAYGSDQTDVAVRSSATAEDLPTASFAGQQESYLNVRGPERLLDAIRDCMASLFTDRAIVYRSERGFEHRKVALSVGIQKMVRSDLASAGVIFTLDTESGFRDAVIVTASYGLGESVVKGRVNPDEFWVHKPTLARGYRPILRREVGAKQVELVYAAEGEAGTRELAVDAERRQTLVLSDDEVLELARWAVRIEKHYSDRAGRPTPMDIEWAKDGPSGRLFIVQARPETVHAQSGPPRFESYRLHGKAQPIVRGKSVGSKIGSGAVRVVRAAADLEKFVDGEVLVAPMTDPDWEPVLKRAAAVVTDQGGRTCHAAIVSRELGLPCIVGSGDATKLLQSGQSVTVSCAEGDEGRVYDGIRQYSRELIDPAALPTPRVPVMLNVGNPELAFRLGQLPAAGVGLARIEFIVNGAIGVHPMALLHPERIADAEVLARIRERTKYHRSPAEFFVRGLASGVAQIAAAFYPRPVIVRFSDFKSNEYAGLLGGSAFEPEEQNPMIGFRGASRYYHERYREAFALECEAIRRVRDEMGLSNVKVMIPFCRTLGEARSVLAELARNQLSRGAYGLEVYVMCEIPNNVILAEEFADLFDGFSIGSNDLTQLTLGIDRDSELLAELFDEQDPGVLRLITTVVKEAHKKGKKVGLCGQAPSDHPEFARFLAQIGIDSISVTSDALPKVVGVLSEPIAGAPGASS